MSIIYFLNPFEQLIIPAQQCVDDFLPKVKKKKKKVAYCNQVQVFLLAV